MSKSKKDLCEEILAYLARNPDAEDTLEGIAQWWLLEQRVHVETERVKQALDELIAQKLLVSRQGLDRRTHYKRSVG